jgi:hypothetical protein
VIADRVLALNRTTADGEGDAPAVDNESVYLLQICDGKVVGVR